MFKTWFGFQISTITFISDEEEPLYPKSASKLDTSLVRILV